jgi:hypothetical protein
LKKILNNKPLLFIILISLIARFFISFGTGLPWISVDSVNYIIQAKALLNGGYEYYFPNGYPLIIALFIFISSLIPFKIGLILFNIFISTIGVVLIYLISEKYFTENKIYPLIAAAVVAFYPNQLNYVRFILTEVPAAFFLILSLYLFTKNRKKLSSLTIGFAFAIRTTVLPVSLLFTIYLFFKKKFKDGILFLAFSLMPLLAFLIYGYMQTGGFTLFIDVPKIFYISLGLEKIPPDFAAGLKEYISYLIKQPINFIYDRILSLWDLWGFLPASNEGLRAGIFFRILIALRFPLLLLAVYGFIKSRKSNLTVFLLMPAFVITFIHSLIITSVNESYIANPRYIFPAEPFLIVLAVKGLEELYNKFFNRQVKTL